MKSEEGQAQSENVSDSKKHLALDGLLGIGWGAAFP